MEMTQMRREDDDMIELHKTPGNRCRDDTIMEITIQGGDDIVDLYNASAFGCTTTLESLIDKDPCIIHKISLTTFSETPLHISALLGHLDFTKTLLTQNPCLAVELDSHKRCPLHLASSEGHIEIVQGPLTIYEDACLFHDQNGRIPLHYAAMRGQVEVVEKLIVA
nr:isoform j of transient receptor potential cation channel subfamily a member 1 [Quercus suber]